MPSNLQKIPVSKEDLQTLKHLESYKKGEKMYVDIDYQGHITSKYPPGKTAQVWRTFNYISGISGNSNDLKKISQVFNRIYIAATYVSRDYSPDITQAIEGLKHLQEFYQEKRPETAEELSKVIEDAESIKELMARDFNNKPKIDYNSEGYQMLTSLSDSVTMPQIKKYDSIHPISGIDYTLKKIEAYLTINGKNLNKKANKIFKTIYERLQCTRYLTIVDLIQKLPEAGVVKSIQELVQDLKDYKKSLANFVFNDLEKLSAEDQMLIGSLIPSGFFTKDYGHFSPIAIRKNCSGEYFLALCNAGDSATENFTIKFDPTNLIFHILNGEYLPITRFGETVIQLGPYTTSEVKEIIPKAIRFMSDKKENLKVAMNTYKSLFSTKQKIKSHTQQRRFQVTGNCVTKNILEWMVEIFIHAKMEKEINDFMLFGSERGRFTSPSLSFAKPLHPKEERKEEISEGWIEIPSSSS